MIFDKLFRRKKECHHQYKVIERSNTIQHDPFGKPLRLCISECVMCGHCKQEWFDTYEQKGDVMLVWEAIGHDL